MYQAVDHRIIIKIGHQIQKSEFYDKKIKIGSLPHSEKNLTSSR